MRNLRMPAADVNRWFDAASEEQRPILDALRELLRSAAPDVVESLKWNCPWYATANGLFCYLQRRKNYVTLGFRRGTSLKDPEQLLEGTGKDMRHVKLTTLAEARDAAIRQMVKQAAKLVD